MTSTVMSRLWKLLAPVRYQYLLSLVAASVIRGGFEITIAIMLKGLVDATLSGSSSALLSTVVRYAAILAGIICVFPVTRAWFEATVLEMTARLRNAVFLHLTRVQLSELRAGHSAERISRLSSDVSVAETTYGASAHSLIETGFWSLGSLLTLAVLSPEMAATAVVLGAIVVLANALLSRPLRALTQLVQERRAEMLVGFSDLLAGADSIRLYGLSSIFCRRLSAINWDVLRGQMKRAGVSARLSAANEFASRVSFLGLLVVGSFLVLRGRLTPGTVIACVQLHSGASQLFYALGDIVSRWRSSLVSMERVLSLLDLSAEPEPVPGTSPPKVSPVRVEFRDVTFGYEDGRPVLSGLSFSIEAGETLALVGPSGSGKSTILKLLLGFYPPWSGSITVDGKDLWGGGLSEIRKLMAYVPQRPHLLGGTVFYNIACGRQDLSIADVQWAARQAYVDAVVAGLPNGYHELLGDGGAKLSEGEQQRICIARAFARRAPLLLLDEPTSALDSESEQHIQEALAMAAGGSTVIFIAHRLWTTSLADRILMLDEGRVIGLSTYHDLSAASRRII